MNTARKILNLLMCICILFACATASADTEIKPDSEATTATAQVVLDLGEQPTSYTVVIPSQITIDPTTGKGSATITLKSGFVLTDITRLSIRMTDGYTELYYVNGVNSSSPVQTHMTLKNSANSSTLTCKILEDIEKDSDLIRVTNQSDNSKDYSKTISFSVSDLPDYGKYTGTLTFSVITA